MNGNAILYPDMQRIANAVDRTPCPDAASPRDAVASEDAEAVSSRELFMSRKVLMNYNSEVTAAPPRAQAAN